MQTTFVRALGTAAISLSLAACGGGGDGTTPTTTAPPPATGSASAPDTSASAPVVVTPPTVAAPVISTPPAAAAVYLGRTASFAVQATGSSIAYQWLRNGAPVSGATAASYTTPATAPADHGAAYSVVVSNTSGSVTSTAAALTIVASPGQQVFEAFYLTPGNQPHGIDWSLTETGLPITGTHYLRSDHVSMAASPLTDGPQSIVESPPVNLAATLAAVAAVPTRVLKNGKVLVVPGTETSGLYTYVDGAVRVDTYATDGTTIAFSQRRSDFTTGPLANALSTTPPEVARWHNVLFTNSALVDRTALFASGSAYLRYTATNIGDRYNVFDCAAVTTDASVSPCRTATTLQQAMSGGMASSSDGLTYFLGDGSVSQVGGVPVWVSRLPRPLTATLTATGQYRIYFELGGNVYTGALVRDGAIIGGSRWTSNPAGATLLDRLTFTTYQIRLNKAAHDSLAAAVKI